MISGGREVNLLKFAYYEKRYLATLPNYAFIKFVQKEFSQIFCKQTR